MDLTLGGRAVRQGEEITHNSLVGRQALVSTLEDPVMSCEVTFQAPTTPGEYKVMIHVRAAPPSRRPGFSGFGMRHTRRPCCSCAPVLTRYAAPGALVWTSDGS